jgi:hypothetical protein
MADELRGLTVAILATDGVEGVELEAPRGALYGAGARTELLSIHDGESPPGSSISTRPARSRSIAAWATPRSTTTTPRSCPGAR